MTIRVYNQDIFEYPKHLEAMYEINSSNMSELLCGHKATINDRKCWDEANRREIIDRGRKTICAFDDGGTLCGYMQYKSIDKEDCSWDEVQIANARQGDGFTLRLLITAFLQDIDFIHCHAIHIYINRTNVKSSALAQRIGFYKAKDTERGACYILNREVLETYIK